MASLIPGFEYDIFISYRQKDNKYDGWVTDFVDNLKRELEATFKEEVSVYFDINPHDGLLETHEVSDSLTKKIKCLVFIPVISQTYCDPKSFAWQHEFVKFVQNTTVDQFGLRVELPGGNISSRVLPVRIHKLDEEDIRLCETVLGSVLRGVEFIYSSAGVNRPLRSKEEKPFDNLNKTIYRDQINKVANAIKEIISGLRSAETISGKEESESRLSMGTSRNEQKTESGKRSVKTSRARLYTLAASFVLILTMVGIFIYQGINKPGSSGKLASSEKIVSIEVLPFQTMKSDSILNTLRTWIYERLISSLSNTREITAKERLNSLAHGNLFADYASLSDSSGDRVKDLKTDLYVFGSINRAGNIMLIEAHLANTKSKEILKSFEIQRVYGEANIIPITDSLAKLITDYLLISNLIKKNPYLKSPFTLTDYPEALQYYLDACSSDDKGDESSAIKYLLKTLAIDSSFYLAAMSLVNIYSKAGNTEENLKWIVKNHNNSDKMPRPERLFTDWQYLFNFESADEQIKCLTQLEEIDDQSYFYPFLLGLLYNSGNLFDKAIRELKKASKIMLRPNNMDGFDGSVFFQLAYAYHKLGQYDNEKKSLGEIQKKQPDHPVLYCRLAIMELALNDTVSANRYIDKYIAIHRENYPKDQAEIPATIGWINCEAGNLDKAEAYYRQALSIEPDNENRLYRLVDFLIDNKRKPYDASEIYNRAIILKDRQIEKAKSKFDYYNCLDSKGWMLYRMGRHKEAFDILQKTWDEAPFKTSDIRSHYEEVKKTVGSQK